MRISPTDVANRTCPYCGRNLCDPNLTTTQTMYRVTGVFGNQISYLMADVDIPKCKNCENNSNSAKVFPGALLAMLTLVLIYCAFIDGGITFLTFLWCEVLAVVVSGISYVASIYGVKFAYGTQGLSNYKPIHIMQNYGWQETAPQKAEEYTTPYSDADNKNMLIEIINECGCKIS